MGRRIVRVETAVEEVECSCPCGRRSNWLFAENGLLCCTTPEPFEALRLVPGDRVRFEARATRPVGRAAQLWHEGWRLAESPNDTVIAGVCRELGITRDTRGRVWWRVKRLPRHRRSTK